MKVEKEGRSFRKPKSTIMIEGQKVSEAGETDKGEERTLLLRKKEQKKRKGVGYRNVIVQEREGN